MGNEFDLAVHAHYGQVAQYKGHHTHLYYLDLEALKVADQNYRVACTKQRDASLLSDEAYISAGHEATVALGIYQAMAQRVDLLGAALRDAGVDVPGYVENRNW